MVKELIHDPILLGRTSAPATEADLQTAEDLLDTLKAHRETCVGMAANMIGVQNVSSRWTMAEPILQC